MRRAASYNLWLLRASSLLNSSNAKVSLGESEQHFDKIRISRRKGAFGEKGDIDRELVYAGP